jgi:hypothetical protein
VKGLEKGFCDRIAALIIYNGDASRRVKRNTIQDPIRILSVEERPNDAELTEREIKKTVAACVFQNDLLNAHTRSDPRTYHLP